MPKNIFVYPCDSFVGRSVCKAFSAAGHAVSGLALTGANVPPSINTVIKADDSDAATAQKQLLLTADVVVYDLLGNERAARDAVVQLAQQPFGGREALFVAVSSPLVWAATRPSPGTLFTPGSGGSAGAGAAEWGDGNSGGDADAAAGGGEGEEAPWAGARGTTGGGSGGGTGSGDGEEGVDGAVPLADAAAIAALFGAPVEHVLARSASTPRVAPTFKAPEDVPRRLPAAPARAAFAVEQLVLRAGRKGRLRTAVVCPGLLYGEGEDDQAFCNAFKAAWTWQCLPTRSDSGPPGPRLLVYGRGTNILPTLHVADLASYIMALAGLPPPPPPTPPPSTTTTTTTTAATAGGAASTPPAGAASSALAPAPASAQTVGGGSVGVHFVSGAFAIGGGSGGGYHLVTDGSRCTQAELVAAIAASMGLGPDEGAIEHVPESELHLHPPALRSRMLLDLSLATTPLPALLTPSSSIPAPSSIPTPASPGPTSPGPPPAAPTPIFFSLSRPGGLPAHLADVAAEFRAIRRLTPLRLLVLGPPLSGKTHLARRLAHRYGLAYISVPLLLAAAGDPAVAAAAGLNPAMDPALLRAAQLEVAAGPTVPSGKEKEKDKDKEGPNPGWLPTGGRVSAKTLGALLGSALAGPRATARCRGFVLDGFPRSAAQARAAFYGLQVDEVAAAALAAEQSHVTVKGHKSHKGERGMGLSANPSTPKLEASGAGIGGGGMAGGGASADVYDVPPAMKLVPNPLTAPTHVIELDVGEEELRARLAAVAAAAEEAVTRVAGEASTMSDFDKKVAGGGTPVKKPPGTGGLGGPGGKGAAGAGLVGRDALLAAALGHNGEAGFGRRLTAYGNWRAEDAADLRSRVAAAQTAWEAECTRAEAERARLAAEASTLKAKRRRARAAAAAAAAAATTTATFNGEDDEDDVAAGNDVAAAGAPAPRAPPELPQHGGLMALSLGAGSATHIRLANPTAPEGPMVTISVQPPAAAALMAAGPAAATSGAVGPTAIANTVAAAAQAAQAATAGPAAQPPALPTLERSIEALLGPPHNLDGFPESGPTPPPPLPVERAAEAAAAAAESKSESRTPRLGPAGSAAAGPAAAAAAVAAGADASYAYRWRGSRGAAVRRYLLHHVVPVVTAALAEVSMARTGGRVPGPLPATIPPSGGSGSSLGDASSQPPTPSAPSSVPGTPGSVVGALGPGSSGKEALLHVARALAAAAAEVEAAFVDPYSDPSYGIQLAKIDAKAARDAARAAVAAAKAEREAAARHQQQQAAAKEEEQ